MAVSSGGTDTVTTDTDVDVALSCSATDMQLFPSSTAIAYSAGTVDVKVGGAVRRLRVSDKVYASLGMYYALDQTWDHASAYTEVREKYIAEGFEDVVAAHGVAAKVAAIDAMRVWANVNAHVMDFGLRHLRACDLVREVDWFSRCEIGQVAFRTKDLDCARNTNSAASYFLAIVGGEGTLDTLELGRATGFMQHRPPGTPMLQDNARSKLTFIEAKWLIVPTPSRTQRARLPMVVMDDNPTRYKADMDSADGLITAVWAAHNVLPMPVCVLPLDGAHFVPRNVKVDLPSWGRSLNNDLHRRYGRERSMEVRASGSMIPGTATAVDEPSKDSCGRLAMMNVTSGGVVRLGAVICMYPYLEARLA